MALILILAGVVTVSWLVRWGRAFVRATGALWFLATGPNRFLSRVLFRIDVRSEQYPYLDQQRLPYKSYRPLARNMAPALVIFHGATPYGEEHPALDNLARALAHTGLIVFIPRLPGLKEVMIDKTSVDAMKAFYAYIQGHECVLPGCVSVIGTSFAGGLMLKALLEQDMRQPPPRWRYCPMAPTATWKPPSGSLLRA